MLKLGRMPSDEVPGVGTLDSTSAVMHFSQSEDNVIQDVTSSASLRWSWSNAQQS